MLSPWRKYKPQFKGLQHFQDFKNKAREFNLIEKKASLEKSKYLKYKILNKESKKKSPVILKYLKVTPQAARKKIPLVRKNIP